MLDDLPIEAFIGTIEDDGGWTGDKPKTPDECLNFVLDFYAVQAQKFKDGLSEEQKNTIIMHTQRMLPNLANLKKMLAALQSQDADASKLRKPETIFSFNLEDECDRITIWLHDKKIDEPKNFKARHYSACHFINTAFEHQLLESGVYESPRLLNEKLKKYPEQVIKLIQTVKNYAQGLRKPGKPDLLRHQIIRAAWGLYKDVTGFEPTSVNNEAKSISVADDPDGIGSSGRGGAFLEFCLRLHHCTLHWPNPCNHQVTFDKTQREGMAKIIRTTKPQQ